MNNLDHGNGAGDGAGRRTGARASGTQYRADIMCQPDDIIVIPAARKLSPSTGYADRACLGVLS